MSDSEYVCAESAGCVDCENTGVIYEVKTGSGFDELLEVEWFAGYSNGQDDPVDCSDQFEHITCEGCEDLLDDESLVAEQRGERSYHLHAKPACLLAAIRNESIDDGDALAALARRILSIASRKGRAVAA